MELGYSHGGNHVLWDVAPYYRVAGDPDANSYAYVGKGGRVSLGAPFSSYAFLLPSSGEYVEYFSVIPYYESGWIPSFGGLYITGYIQRDKKEMFYLRTDKYMNPISAFRYTSSEILNAVIYRTVESGRYLIHTGYVERDGSKHMFLMSTMKDGSPNLICVFEDSLESVALDVVPLGDINYALVGYAWDRRSGIYGVRVITTNLQCALNGSRFYTSALGESIIGYAGAITRDTLLHVVGTSVNSDGFKKAFMITMDVQSLYVISSYEYVSPGGYRDSSLAVFDVVSYNDDLILVGIASSQYLLRDSLPKVIQEANGAAEYPNTVCGGDAMAFGLHDDGSPSWGYLIRYSSYQDENSTSCSYEGALYSVKLSGTDRMITSGHLMNVPGFLSEYGYSVEALRSNGYASTCSYMYDIASVPMKVEAHKPPTDVIVSKVEVKNVPMWKDNPFFTTCTCDGGCTNYTARRSGVQQRGCSLPSNEIEAIFRADGSLVPDVNGIEDLPKGIYMLKTKRGIRKVIVR